MTSFLPLNFHDNEFFHRLKRRTMISGEKNISKAYAAIKTDKIGYCNAWAIVKIFNNENLMEFLIKPAMQVISYFKYMGSGSG